MPLSEKAQVLGVSVASGTIYFVAFLHGAWGGPDPTPQCSCPEDQRTVEMPAALHPPEVARCVLHDPPGEARVKGSKLHHLALGFVGSRTVTPCAV